MTVDQVLRALWRRKLLVLAIAAGVFTVGAAIVVTLPSSYKATTVVRVEPQQPDEEMVHHTVSEQVVQRIATIRQELLARPVLQRAIEQLGLYPDLVKERGMDAAVARMREDLDVKVEGENAFQLTYTSDDPQLAQKVATVLPEIFSKQAVKGREEQAARAANLFDDEVKQLQKQVSAWEQKIEKFKIAHLGELPEQLESNMRGLERVGAQMQDRMDQLRAAENRRADLLTSHYAWDSQAGRIEAHQDELQKALLAARTQWTEDHPEVKRLEEELAGTKAELRDAEARRVAQRQERARMAGLVATLKSQISDLQKQADAYQKRLDNTPRWAQQLSVLNRDYEIVKTKYESVISRKVEAEIAQELELRAAHDLFHVISPAALPTQPASPDRMGGLLISLIVALALGVLVGVLVDMRDDSIRDVGEVKDRLPIPVLAVVPQMGGKTERRVLMPHYGQNNIVTPETLN